MEKIVDILKILSDKTRLKIISLLAENELCVCELMEALKMSQSRISNHLRILRNVGIIEAKREGKWMFYYIARDKMDESIFNLIMGVVKIILQKGYLEKERRIVEKLIPERGKPGHCPLPHLQI